MNWTFRFMLLTIHIISRLGSFLRLLIWWDLGLKGESNDFEVSYRRCFELFNYDHSGLFSFVSLTRSYSFTSLGEVSYFDYSSSALTTRRVKFANLKSAYEMFKEGFKMIWSRNHKQTKQSVVVLLHWINLLWIVKEVIWLFLTNQICFIAT